MITLDETVVRVYKVKKPRSEDERYMTDFFPDSSRFLRIIIKRIEKVGESIAPDIFQ
jgi:hypothetical protein